MRIKEHIIILTIVMVTMQFGLLSASEYGGEFFDLGAGARAVGMGGTFVSIPGDPASSYWNPAGVMADRKSDILIMHTSLYGGLASYDYLTLTYRVIENRAVALSVLRFAVDDIPEYPPIEPGEVPPPLSGYFSDREYIINLSFSQRWNFNFFSIYPFSPVPSYLSIGGAIKYFEKRLKNYRGIGQGADLGLIFCFDLGKLVAREWLGDLSFGTSIKNIAARVVWDTEGARIDTIGITSEVGLSYYQPFGKGNLILAVSSIPESGEMSYGLEYSPIKSFAVRVGSYRGYLSTGGGINFWKLSINYAFQSHPLGSTNRVDICISFD
ncbi:hypothetical protein KAX02_02450 [candidate division WOR-3 bacterium]|nr:hypothetical protein [candidate division WOR-3 bacterium]